MAYFDVKKISERELSDSELNGIYGGVAVDLAKAGLGEGSLDITPALIDTYAKMGQLSALIGMFGYVGSIYASEIEQLYEEYKGSGYDMPAELDAVLKQFL